MGVTAAVAMEPLTLRTEEAGPAHAPQLDISGPVIVLQAEPVVPPKAEVVRAPEAAVAVEVAPPEAIEAEVAVTVAAAVEADSTSPESTELSEILEKERGLAHQFFKRLEIADAYVARLAVKIPEVAEKVKTTVEETATEVREKVAMVQDKVADKIKKLETSISDVDRLPLSDLTANTGLMKKAKLSFDEQSTTWSAVWKKPALFHFGMILHPELMEQVNEGEKLHFESKGMKLALVRTGDDKLLVEQTNGARHELSAKRLEGLLQRSIKVDGLELSLDGGGNLVLKAEGEKAKLLASKFSLL